MTIFNQVVAGGGTTPTGTIQITTNGTHDVTNYANADVQVPTTAPAYYIEKKIASSIHGPQLCSKGVATVIDLTGVQSLDVGVLAYAYRLNDTITQVPDFSGIVWLSTDSMKSVFDQASALTGVVNLSSVAYCDNNSLYTAFAGTGITGINLHSLGTINATTPLQGMCQFCSQLLSVDLANLQTISSSNGAAYAFQNCTNLTSADLPSLTTLSGSNACSYMFQNCRGISTLDLSSLVTISGNNACSRMYEGCTGLTSVSFPSLTTVTGSGACNSMFYGCTNLTSLSFYALNTNSFGTRTNQFGNMLVSVTGCTVHFPMAIQSTIGSWSDVTNGFGGTNTTVLFDIVTTLTGADTNTYTRKQKDSTSTATAWVYNDTLYYTSGTTEPSVSDAIYSDAACTQSVTTVSAIA